MKPSETLVFKKIRTIWGFPKEKEGKFFSGPYLSNRLPLKFGCLTQQLSLEINPEKDFLYKTWHFF